MYDHAYDRGGAYWGGHTHYGHGKDSFLFCAHNKTGRVFFRAAVKPSGEDLKAVIKNGLIGCPVPE